MPSLDKCLAEVKVMAKDKAHFVEFGKRPMTALEKGIANGRRFTLAYEAASEGRLRDIPHDIFKRRLPLILKLYTEWENKSKLTKRIKTC